MSSVSNRNHSHRGSFLPSRHRRRFRRLRCLSNSQACSARIHRAPTKQIIRILFQMKAPLKRNETLQNYSCVESRGGARDATGRLSFWRRAHGDPSLANRRLACRRRHRLGTLSPNFLDGGWLMLSGPIRSICLQATSNLKNAAHFVFACLAFFDGELPLSDGFKGWRF